MMNREYEPNMQNNEGVVPDPAPQMHQDFVEVNAPNVQQPVEADFQQAEQPATPFENEQPEAQYKQQVFAFVDQPSLEHEETQVAQRLPLYHEVYTGKQKKSSKKGGFWRYFATGVAGMVVGAMIFGSALLVADSGKHTAEPLQQNSIAGYIREVAFNSDGSMSVVDIAKKAGPAVVGVLNTRTTTTFFGTQMEQEGGGSGIIIKPDGYIVTNAHVVEGATTVKVELSTGKSYDAKLVGLDERTDLAVIKIDGTNLPYVEIGKSSELEVGELAVAIGNPGGQEFAGSVTVGVISALNRSMNVQNRQYNLIQTDAAINPGNSGGALLNRFGQLVGINSVKIGGSGYEGMGFAIPIDDAMPIINELMTGAGYIKGRPLIGVGTRDITEQLSRAYQLPIGVYITTVAEFSAAEKAGLQIGDVIIKADGKDIKNRDELDKVKNTHKAGEKMSLVIVREGTQINVELTLDEETPNRN